MRILLTAAAASLCALAASTSAQAIKTTLVANGYSQPLFVISPPKDFNRLFVVEQGGAIRIIKNGVKLATPFLHLGPVGSGGLGLTTSSGEQGLLGFAFRPDYSPLSGSTNYFYVYYTNNSGNNVLARYRVNGDGDTANPAGLILLTFLHPVQSNHNGGMIGFGPDGYLYIGTGDGGGANDGPNNAQNINSYLGKIHRIDVSDAAGLPYGVPPNNPFVGVAGLDEIFAIGARNPWRFSFDRINGDLYIGDVGQNAREEVHYIAGTYVPVAGGAPLNLGWRCYEGNNQTNLGGCVYPNTYPGTDLRFPIHEYANPATGRTVAGGYVYRGCAIPGLRGTYFFSDYISNRHWSFKVVGGVLTNFVERTAELAPGGGLNLNSVASYGEDALGEVYMCDRSGGEIFRIDAVSPVQTGVASYGTGTAGCNGNQVLSVNCSPVLGNPGLRFDSTNSPASTIGLGLISDAQDLAGSDPFGIGANLHVDLLFATEVLTLDFVSNAAGLGTVTTEIPNNAILIGKTYFAQTLWVWTTCALPPFNISTSSALSLTIQP